MTNPYVTEEAAKKLCIQIFNDAMKRWNDFCQENYPQYVAKTQLTPDVIIWKKIGFRTAGKTGYVISRQRKIFNITMNTNYLWSKDANEFIDSTLRHEIAHAVANLFNGSWGHDKTWKVVARVIGDSGERCHNYATPENIPAGKSSKRVRTTFVCPTCGTEFHLTPLMIKRCSAGDYRCRHCKTGMETFVK